MITPDHINAAFELLAGFFVLHHCKVLYDHKEVKGVSLISVIFFTGWGFWNLYQYPSLGQWWSFYGGLGIVATNLLWVSMMIYYTRYHNKNEGVGI